MITEFQSQSLSRAAGQDRAGTPGSTSARKLLLFTVGLVVAAACFAEQPVAYSHKQHLAMGLTCLDCHSTADTGAAATIPSVQKCMLCHAKIATAKPEIKKIIDYFSNKREIPWERIYGFPASSLVKFQHAPHVRAKVACATCHGDMTQATTAQRLVNHTMGTCLSCHRQNRASEDCTACHY